MFSTITSVVALSVLMGAILAVNGEVVQDKILKKLQNPARARGLNQEETVQEHVPEKRESPGKSISLNQEEDVQHKITEKPQAPRLLAEAIRTVLEKTQNPKRNTQLNQKQVFQNMVLKKSRGENIQDKRKRKILAKRQDQGEHNHAIVAIVGGSVLVVGVVLVIKRRNSPHSEYDGETKRLNQGGQSLYQSNRHVFVPPVSSHLPESRKHLRTSFLNENFNNSHSNNPTIYNNPELLETHRDKVNKIRKFEFGKKIKSGSEKVILLVGATGSGKTTLVNGLFNYIMGIERPDNIRVKLTDLDAVSEDQHPNEAQSQTKWITAYTIHHQPWFKVPYTVTIIDTPGFGDTAGTERDKEITKQIETLFRTEGENGMDHLDAVGFVSPASLARLTPTQKYIFDSVLSLFGKDLKNNIFMMLTFADGQTPQILSSIQEANVPHKTYFQFNNSALYANNVDDDDSGLNLNKMFWDLGVKSFDTFMNELYHFEPKSLILTRELMAERRRLETLTKGAYFNVGIELNKLEELKMDHQILKRRKNDVDRGISFMYNIKVQNLQTEGIDSDENEHFVYTAKLSEVNKSSQQLRDKYDKKSGKHSNAKQMAKQCSIEIKNAHTQIKSLAEQIQNHITRINEIALKPNVPTGTHPLDLLIKGERYAQNPGWEKRVEQLEDVKNQDNNIQEFIIRHKKPLIFFGLAACVAGVTSVTVVVALEIV